MKHIDRVMDVTDPGVQQSHDACGKWRNVVHRCGFVSLFSYILIAVNWMGVVHKFPS